LGQSAPLLLAGPARAYEATHPATLLTGPAEVACSTTLLFLTCPAEEAHSTTLLTGPAKKAHSTTLSAGPTKKAHSTTHLEAPEPSNLASSSFGLEHKLGEDDLSGEHDQWGDNDEPGGAVIFHRDPHV
jgi:hypothetical protein